LFPSVQISFSFQGLKRSSGGSPVIFTKAGVVERINLQADGSKPKGYQVRQVRAILTKYP
jgi:hypothetical protein